LRQGFVPNEIHMAEHTDLVPLKLVLVEHKRLAGEKLHKLLHLLQQQVQPIPNRQTHHDNHHDGNHHDHLRGQQMR
jgi:hypothetical protein